MNLYPEGIDCIWIAMDQNGALAAFVTAGVAPIPTIVLNSSLLELENIEQIVIEQFPVIGEANLKVDLPRPDDFIAISKRGLFVYDWDDNEQQYVLISIPTYLKNYADLARNLKIYIQTLALNSYDFSKSNKINVYKDLICNIAD
ncbi:MULTISPECIES: hypothetical protein [Acinetobacter]|uniref:Uncharacterized protein n=1 Tax=Acinetobacter higginsii TaxID=70347 RepID=N9SNV4_9GAMM|nr:MULTISPECIES: hypothetical protein [Acinetobacter]ENX52977.1 hypothetical protein F902_03839 [Acinetobacter higginsii]MCH7339484.1 hypothetical protein [Acinetobacter higginsii]MCJ0827821.1 hypothetical protein [Acinetobacter sp. NIPH1876]MDO3664727.1 hypothetical protein [Acinetobacter higginsii]